MASNVLPHKDRNSINELSIAANGTDRRPPINNRDASSRTIWKNQTATAIPVPGQSRRRLTDPYTPTGFTANRTASQTLTARPKRQRPSRINLRDTEPSVIRGKSKGKQKAALAPPYDIVNVDDDEDLGQPLPLTATRARSSPDQLDCIRDGTHFRRPTELETQVRLPPIHPFDEKGDTNAPSSSKAPHISRHHTQSSDPIEEYPQPARPLSTSGRVREMVSEINAQNQSIGLRVPHVDLAKEEKSKTKDKMKPKRGNILLVEAAPQVQHPRLQVKRAFIGLREFGEKQTSFQYSSKQLILTIHCKPPKSLTFALDGEVFRLSMSNRQADEPFLVFSAIHFGYSGSSRLQLDQSEEGSVEGRVLLLFEDDQPGLKDKIAGLVEVTRSLGGAEYLDGAGARGIFEREMRLLEDLKRRRSSDGLEGSKTRRTVPTTKPISGVKRKIPDEEDQVTPRKRSTNPSQDVSIMDHKPSAEDVGPRRRSARQILIADDALRHRRQSRQPRLDPDEIILVYPPNTTGAVTIKNSDLDRLQPGEFLNDTLIEFGLKLWLKDLEESHPELAKDVYVFSSFFYKKLKVRNVEDGYQSVRKWTSKFDIFQKKYIIVPINENLHWYLAIIYEPEHILLPPVIAPPRLTRKMGRRKVTDAPVNNVALSKIPQTPEEDLAELTNEMLISPRDRSKTPSDVQEVVDQLEPESEDEPIGGGPTDSPLTDMEALESVHATGGRARSLSASESGSRFILLNDDTSMSEDEPPIELQPSVESESNDIIIDETPSPDPPTLLSNNVNVKQFYGKSSKAPAPDFTTSPMFHGVDDQANAEATPEVQMGDPLPPRTYIFTLDSLGTRHTAVYKTLNTYLKLEAKDKKDYDLTSEGVGIQALVPYQPNHCDCGIYLLHFAQTFMKDPGTYCNIIKRRRGAGYDLRQRQIDWDDTSVGDYREKLAARIKELSVIWKRDKGVKNPDAQEAQADPFTRTSSSKTSPETDVVPDSEGSDEDIEIVGMSRVHTGGKAKGTPRTKGRSQASRLRG